GCMPPARPQAARRLPRPSPGTARPAPALRPWDSAALRRLRGRGCGRGLRHPGVWRARSWVRVWLPLRRGDLRSRLGRLRRTVDFARGTARGRPRQTALTHQLDGFAEADGIALSNAAGRGGDFWARRFASRPPSVKQFGCLRPVKALAY